MFKEIDSQMYQNFRRNLRNKRKELGLTQKELAKLANVSFRTIQNIKIVFKGDSEIRNFHKIISQWKEYLDYQLGVIEE